MIQDWYTIAEKWPWPPESIDNLDIEDFFRHADFANAMFEEQAKRQGKQK